MPKSVKSLIFTFRLGRWLVTTSLLGLLLACGGGAGEQDNSANGSCDSIPSDNKTANCTGSDGTGTYTLKTETASCSPKRGQAISWDKSGCTTVAAQGNACQSVLSAAKTEACPDGQLGTHTYQTETASCSGNSGKIVVDAIAACLLNTPANRIKLALIAGDSRILKAEDAAPLMDSAYQSYKLKIDTENRLIDDFYKTDSTQFDIIKESFWVQPSITTQDQVFPFVIGDKGNILASVSMAGDNRVVGYGYDILAGFDITNSVQGSARTNQTAHRPVFKRVLAWLVKGDSEADLTAQDPSKLSIAWGSLPTTSTYFSTPSLTKLKKPYAVAGLISLGISNTNLDCDPLSAAVKDCAAKAQLVVLGASDQRADVKSLLPTQLQRIREIMQARIPILYLSAHPSGGSANDWAGKQFDEDFDRLKALGFSFGVDPNLSNYHHSDYVDSGLAPAKLQARNDPLGANLLARIKDNNFDKSYDWSKCTVDKDCVLPQGFTDDIVTPLNKVKTLLDGINKKGQNLFDPQMENTSLKKLVLWADAYRQNIVYPINKTTHPVEFQKAYIADALVAYVRKAGSAQTDLGNFLSPDVRQVKGSTAMENVNVTLPGSDGFTAVGRFVLPGQAITLQMQKAPTTGSFSFFINTAGPGNTKLFSSPVDANGKQLVNMGYRRPRLPSSPDFPISTQPITIVSPYGGLLQLRFSGATDASVVLQIQGAARQPFYDTTQGTADAAIFLNDFQTSKLGWLEIKTSGIEIHSLISRAKEFLLPDQSSNAVYPSVSKPYYNSTSTGIDMGKYLAETKKYITEDAYQLAGFQVGGLQINSQVKSFCAAYSWDCVSATIHKPPSIQHFHSDYAANCGWACSGNPITSGSGFGPRGWGESHELGHNLQRFKVYGGISGEVSNNIFPLHQKWRLLIDLKRDAIGYYNELPETQLVFDMIKKTFKDGNLDADQKVLRVKQDLWTDPVYAAQNRLRLYFYLQWPLLYADIIKTQNPSMSEADAIEAGWDIYTLMYLNQRQVEASTNWLNDKAKLGFSQYSDPPTTDNGIVVNGIHLYHDYMLVALSLITGYDQRPMFDFWGITTSSAGKDQVAALRNNANQALPMQPVKFYATRCADDFRAYKSLDMTQSDPQFPWKDEFKASTDSSSAISSKQTQHTNYCLSVKQ